MAQNVQTYLLFRSVLVIALLTAGFDASGQQTVSSAISNEATERVVVLQDGGVLVGQLRRDGDRVVVSRGGGEMRIPAANVLCDCESLDDAYKFRRGQIAVPTADAHLSLAEWCLRYRLMAHAATELAAAKALDERHPRIPLVARRVAVLQQPARPATPAASPAVQQASATEEVSTDRARANKADVPVEVVKRFTRKVQPVLVNNCTTAGCHQPGGEQSFQLDRVLLHGLANRRSTMSNLTAALALVDREQPHLSPLLTVPRTKHGGMEGPVFGARHEQAYRHLVEWVALVTRKEQQEAVVSKSAAAAALVTPAAIAARKLANEIPPTPNNASEVERAVLEVVAEEEAALQPGVKFGAQVERWQPRDEFDPEIFNRRQRLSENAATARGAAGQQESQ